MSEDLNQLPGEPEKAGQPLGENSSSQEPTPQEAERPQPVSESIIPEQPAPARPHYPPSPEFYAQMPAVDPYGAPSVDYRTLPPPPVQGAPGFPQPAQDMSVFPPSAYGYGLPPSAYNSGFPPSQAQPLPLGQAIRELPRQYKKILFKPGAHSFAQEQGKADWGIVWLQILFLGFLQALVSIPLFLAYNQALSSSPSMASAGVDASFFSSPAILLLEIVLEVILMPLIFFASVGIQYLVAKAFKGLGGFKQQAYNQLLFQVPIGLVTSLISLILSTFIGRTLATSLNISATASATTSTSLISGPYLLVLLLFDLISLGAGVYSIILNVFSIMAAHRLSGGRATASVLIPYGVLILLVMLCVCALFFVSFMAVSSAVHP